MAEHPAPALPARPLATCPICEAAVLAEDINSHLDSGDCPGAPQQLELLPVAGTVKTRKTKLKTKPNDDINLLDIQRHEKRRAINASRNTMFSPAQKQDMKHTAFQAASDSFDYLLHGMQDEHDADLIFLAILRSFVYQHFSLPPEILTMLLRRIESPTVSIRDSNEMFLCFREILAIHPSQWTPLNTDWDRFLKLVDIIKVPQAYVDSVRSSRRKSLASSSSAKHKRGIRRGGLSTLGLGDLVEPLEMLHKQILLLQVHLGAFEADLASRKSSGACVVDGCSLRNLIKMSSDSVEVMKGTAAHLYNECTMAQLAMHADRPDVPDRTSWTCVFLAEHLQRLLIESFPDVSLA